MSVSETSPFVTDATTQSSARTPLNNGVTPVPSGVAATGLHSLQQQIAPLLEKLTNHPLYSAIRSLENLHIFLESHVFAVWDFMSLLKSLQRGLTCVEVPWRPSPLAESRRLINEIVLGEESDLYEGEAISHFELYCRAMQQCGASTEAIDNFLFQLAQDESVESCLDRVRMPQGARDFVRTTFGFIGSGQLHSIAAAFTFGREDLIPDLFRAFLREENDLLSGRLALLRWYLDRHIEVDGEEHGPMALSMITQLCGSNPLKWQEAASAAKQALEARIALWDSIHAALKN